MSKKLTMKAILTLQHGGFEVLSYQDVPIPSVSDGSVLVKVLAAGVNNTEINTRLGWYSSSVTEGTSSVSCTPSSSKEIQDGGWNAQTPFPFIQGTDCCGIVSEVGSRASNELLGKRVLIRPCMRVSGWESLENVWMGSDFDGAFAQYVRVPESEVFPIESEFTDAELGSFPCAYGTAENMIHRSNVSLGDTVLVTGASGGVGSATIQLTLRRGATVYAITSDSKKEELSTLGAHKVISRDADILALLGERSVDVVIDNVAGTHFPSMLKVLKRGGRLATSGAIAGPIVQTDLRDLYLKDLTIIGCTAWDEPVFPNLISYIERKEIRPIIAGVYPLEHIAEVQQLFLQKTHIGKYVLIPPR